jgi:hypothetical protein
MYPNNAKKVFTHQDCSVHGTYWNGFWYAAPEEISFAEVLRKAIENDGDSYHYREAVQYLFDNGFINEIQYNEARRSLMIVYQQVEGYGRGTLTAGTLNRAKIVAQEFANKYPDTAWKFRVIPRGVYWEQGEKGSEIASWTCSGPVLPKTKAQVSMSKAWKVLKEENLEALEGVRFFEITMPNLDGDEKCWFNLKWVDSRYNETHSISRVTNIGNFENTARWACAYLKENGLYLDLFRHFNEDGSRWPREQD